MRPDNNVTLLSVIAVTLCAGLLSWQASRSGRDTSFAVPQAEQASASNELLREVVLERAGDERRVAARATKGRLRGCVVGGDPSAMRASFVRLVGPGRRIVAVPLAADGTFEVVDLEWGEWELGAHVDGHHAPPVRVELAKNEADLVLELDLERKRRFDVKTISADSPTTEDASAGRPWRALVSSEPMTTSRWKELDGAARSHVLPWFRVLRNQPGSADALCTIETVVREPLYVSLLVGDDVLVSQPVAQDLGEVTLLVTGTPLQRE